MIGAAAVVLLGLLIPYFNYTLDKYDWAFRPLALGPVFLLFLLALPVNRLLHRLQSSWVLTGPELLLVYAMMAICAPFASEGLVAYTTAASVHPLYFASPENGWAQTVLPNVPSWLMVNQPEAVRWFYEGKPAGAALPWVPWVIPMVAWSVFAFSLYTAFFALGCLMRKDWIEGQRLTFPITELPTEMAGSANPSADGSFFRAPLLWIGFAIPAAQSMLEMAHVVWPAVPYSGLYFSIGQAFAGNGPWDSLRDMHASIGFETIGILALLPKDVSLSLWLFYIVSRVEILSFAVLGYGQAGIGASQFSPGAFIMYQEAGAAIVFAAIVLWQSRRSIAAAFRALAGQAAPYDPLAPVSPRMAAGLLVLSLAAMSLWGHRAGMNSPPFIAAMAVFFAFSLAIARLVGAAGVFVPLIGLAPRDLLVGLTGSAAYSPRSLTVMTYLQAVIMNGSTWKVNFLHFAMNDLKMAHSARIPGRLLTGALALAVVLMLAVAPAAVLHAVYAKGGQLLNPDIFGADAGQWGFAQLASSLREPEARTPFLPLGLLCGGAAMMALSWLHLNYLWWGVSPVGFILGGTWGMDYRLWTNALVAWALVVVLMRVGGLRLYRRSRPVFLGMVLGHYVLVGLRTMIDPLFGISGNLGSA